MTYLYAFLIGGAICVLAQILIDLTNMTPARIVVLFVCLGALLAAFGLYQPLVDLAGAGATVPISGFGYSLVKGVREAVKEQGFIGIVTGGITATAGGISAAILFGFIFSLIGKSRPK